MQILCANCRVQLPGHNPAGTVVSHGICHPCLHKLYGAELAERVIARSAQTAHPPQTQTLQQTNHQTALSLTGGHHHDHHLAAHMRLATQPG